MGSIFFVIQINREYPIVGFLQNRHISTSSFTLPAPIESKTTRALHGLVHLVVGVIVIVGNLIDVTQKHYLIGVVGSDCLLLMSEWLTRMRGHVLIV